MNTTKIENFTPGKWRVSNKAFNDSTSISAGLGAISIIADLPDGEDLFVAEAFGDVFEGDPAANAQLIAMAPTLYAENQRLKEVNAELVEAAHSLSEQLRTHNNIGWVLGLDHETLVKYDRVIQKATQP